MIHALHLDCPAGHTMAIFFFKPERMNMEHAAITLAGLQKVKAFSDICPRCGQTAEKAVCLETHASEWTDIPEIRVAPETEAVLVIRTANGGMRHGEVKSSIIKPSNPARN
jgi:hypothetical protein